MQPDLGRAENLVLRRIQDMKSEIVDFAIRLLGFRAISPNADYSQISNFLSKEYKGIGLDTKRISASKEKVARIGFLHPRYNVLGLLRGAHSKPTLEIYAHMDTVAADGSKWESHPLEPKVSGSRIYGLGAIDARCSLAASFFAAKAIIESEIRLNGNLLIAGTVDDETESDESSWPGTAYLMEEGHRLSRLGVPDLVINAESSGLQNVWGLFKGRYTFEFDVKGRRAHAGTSYGINAIDKATKFIDALRSSMNEKHPIMGSDSVFLYSIRAGEDGHIDIPDNCHVGIDIRYVGDQRENRGRQEVQRLACDLKADDPDFQFENLKERRSWEVFQIDQNHVLVQSIMRAASKVGIDAKYGGPVGAGQNYPYLKNGIPCVTYGAGDMSRAHAANEYVTIGELVDQTKVYALTALRLCGLARG